MTAAPPQRPASAEPDRRHRRRQRTRAAIEAAALELFTAQGFGATTVEQIAEAADIAPRTFFRHFPSKDAVLFGDPAHEAERMREVIAELPAGVPPLRAVATAMLDAADRMEPDRAQHLMRARLLDNLESGCDYELQLLKQRWVQDIAEVVAERLGTGTDDPRAAAWTMTLMACFGAAVHSWLVRTDDRPLRAIFVALLAETGGGLVEFAEQTR
ncbi:TetR/AcrR family transcriptional regulator [Saccharopolyspora sp. CA-218241]|uniref:TetR/AcrR family transcriptional regulator n=1 Tax=Saccharopolyspora sp. CA-218241 TaxID=3240027 RepID=UPI003D970854